MIFFVQICFRFFNVSIVFFGVSFLFSICVWYVCLTLFNLTRLIVILFVCNWFKCMNIEITYVSIFNDCMKMILNVSTINRKHLFYMIVNLFSNIFDVVLILLNACQTTNAYVIADFTTTMYTWRILKNDVFHMNYVIFVNVNICLIIFFVFFLHEHFILILCLFVNQTFWCSILKWFRYL